MTIIEFKYVAKFLIYAMIQGTRVWLKQPWLILRYNYFAEIVVICKELKCGQNAVDIARFKIFRENFQLMRNTKVWSK